MRLALLMMALLVAPAAFANTAPPDEPSYEKPEFEKPETPPTPTPPEEPEEEPDNDGGGSVSIVPPPATALACPKVKCVTDASGKRVAMFTADVQPDMYYLGRNFCAEAPQDMEVTACCLEENGIYKILYNTAVSNKAHGKAKQFCTCVLELD